MPFCETSHDAQKAIFPAADSSVASLLRICRMSSRLGTPQFAKIPQKRL